MAVSVIGPLFIWRALSYSSSKARAQGHLLQPDPYSNIIQIINGMHYNTGFEIHMFPETLKDTQGS